jgi:hypothetical protein
VFATDEHRLGLKPVARRVWAPVGARPVALGHHRFEWLYVTAFVSPATGETVWYLSNGVSKPFFEELLTAFAKRVGAGRERIVVLVLDNADLAFVSWEQRASEGTPKYDESQILPSIPYDGWAESLGLRGIRVERPDKIEPAWEAALAADRPTVIHAVVDPAEVMLPPHFTAEQARNTVASVLRGDSDWRGIVRRGLPSAVATYLPHRDRD